MVLTFGFDLHALFGQGDFDVSFLDKTETSDCITIHHLSAD
jgi:hypothetical protein